MIYNISLNQEIKMSNTYKLFKLLTGEFVLGEVESFSGTGTGTKLKNPVIIVLQEGVEKPAAYFAPFIPFTSSDNVTLFNSAIVAVAEPDEVLLKQYVKMFGSESGIIIANVLPK